MSGKCFPYLFLCGICSTAVFAPDRCPGIRVSRRYAAPIPRILPRRLAVIERNGVVILIAVTAKAMTGHLGDLCPLARSAYLVRYEDDNCRDRFIDARSPARLPEDKIDLCVLDA